MIKQENYINIQGWMVSELGLKGNDLIIYAIIYGFTQDGQTKFQGTLQYLADWTNSTKQGVIKNLKGLVERGLIKKNDYEKNGVKYCEYYTTEFNGGIKQSLTGGIKQSLTNTIDTDKLDNNININNKNIIKKVGSKFSVKTNQVIIDENFSASQCDELKVYVQEMPEDVIHSVENWLIKSKLGQPVDCAFIAKQFINFAKRQGRPFFKEGV